MDGQFVGHRSASDNDWSWDAAPPPGGRPGSGTGGFSRRTLLFAALAMFALAAVFWTLALVVDRGGGTVASSPTPSPHESPSPSPAPAGSPTPTRTPTLRPTASPGPTPSPAPSASATPATLPLRLAAWLPGEERWAEGGLAQPTGKEFSEGGAMTSLVRIDGTHPGDSYQIEIMYDCATEKSAAFDFLTSVEPEASALTAPGPGRAIPDAAIPVPDDPDITFDDAATGRTFRLWGGSFEAAPTGPLSETPCRPGQSNAKRLVLTVTARQETLFVMFGAHLASASDWGAGKGASNAGAKLGVSARVAGGDWLTQALPPGSVGP